MGRQRLPTDVTSRCREGGFSNGRGTKAGDPIGEGDETREKRDIVAGGHRFGWTPHPDCLGVAWSSPAYWNWPEPTAALAVLTGQNKGRHMLDHCPKVYCQYNSNEVLVLKVRYVR